jgi:hypothetical protein
MSVLRGLPPRGTALQCQAVVPEPWSPGFYGKVIRLPTSPVPPFLPFDERAAIEYGRIREETQSRGTPSPVGDTMIAAIARPLRLRVLSHDEPLRWVPRLQVEDWLA